MYKFRILNWIKLLLDFYDKQKMIIIDETSLSPSREEFLLSILYLLNLSDVERFFDTALLNKEDFFAENKTPHEFYKIVDHLRTEFASFFKDLILNRDFSDSDYVKLALEYLLLDEQVTKQIRIPLLDKLKKLTKEGNYAVEDGKPFDEEKRLLRLWKFFSALELFEKDKKEEILEETRAFLKDKAQFIVPKLPENLENFRKVFYDNLEGLFRRYEKPLR